MPIQLWEIVGKNKYFTIIVFFQCEPNKKVRSTVSLFIEQLSYKVIAREKRTQIVEAR